MDSLSKIKFHTWVPTVTGKLSFTIIGKTAWPRSCFHENLIDHRHVAIFLQERFCHDFLAPFLRLSDRQKEWLFGFQFGKRRIPLKGRHFFICVVKAGENDSLGKLERIVGTIFVIPSTDQGKEKFKALKSEILSLKKISNDGEKAAKISELAKEYAKFSLLEASFVLFRNGEFLLAPVQINTIKDFGRISKRNVLNRYCALMYSFMRDITHNHQHHDGENDLIVRLHAEESENPNHWKDQVFFDLFRRVIAFKRVRSPLHITNATGILAYARAFKEIFEPPAAKSGYCEDATIQSLETAQYELQMMQGLKNNRLAFVQALIFGLLTLVVGVTGFSTFLSESQKSEIRVSETIRVLIQFGAEWPSVLAFAAFILSYAIYSFTGHTSPERKTWYKDGLRVLNSLPKPFSVALLLSFGFLMLIISFFGIWWVVG